MPNWVFCTLMISGDKEELSVLRNKVVDNCIFESLYPGPKELEETPARFIFSDDLSPIEKLNLKKFGAVNWYYWNIIHWGTKWGDVETELVTEDDNHLNYETQFAWRLPIVGIAKISKSFPDLIFSLENVWEESGAFHGEIAFKNGKVVINQLKKGYGESELMEQSSWKEKWVDRFHHIFSHLVCFWSKI